MSKWQQVCTGWVRDTNDNLVPCRKPAWADGKCKRHHEEYQMLLRYKAQYIKFRKMALKAAEI